MRIYEKRKNILNVQESRNEIPAIKEFIGFQRELWSSEERINRKIQVLASARILDATHISFVYAMTHFDFVVYALYTLLGGCLD